MKDEIVNVPTNESSGNKLIAEFMEFDISANMQWIDDEDSQKRRKIEIEGTEQDLKYHSSWDWLMRACKRWDCLIFDNNDEYIKRSDELDNAITKNYDIREAWEELVYCIKWYNQQKAVTK